MSVQPVPEGRHTVSPYLIVHGASQLMEFLKKAFDAKEIELMTRPDGTVAHAEMEIGDSVVMLAEATGESKAMPAAIHLYVNDVDETYQRALQGGATSVMEPTNQFYGNRQAGVQDASDNFWWIATHVEDVSPQELKKRAAAAFAARR